MFHGAIRKIKLAFLQHGVLVYDFIINKLEIWGKVLAANTLHFKAIFDSPLKKGVRRAAVPGEGCASKTWSFSSACKNLGAQHPLGAEIWSS